MCLGWTSCSLQGRLGPTGRIYSDLSDFLHHFLFFYACCAMSDGRGCTRTSGGRSACASAPEARRTPLSRALWRGQIRPEWDLPLWPSERLIDAPHRLSRFRQHDESVESPREHPPHFLSFCQPRPRQQSVAASQAPSQKHKVPFYFYFYFAVKARLQHEARRMVRRRAEDAGDALALALTGWMNPPRRPTICSSARVRLPVRLL